jgi:hypothetical protein
MKITVVGASGRSPVSDSRLSTTGDLPVAHTISAVFGTVSDFLKLIRKLDGKV